MIRAGYTQCALWRWFSDGKLHARCTRETAVLSVVPGRITREVCAECHQQRLKEANR